MEYITNFFIFLKKYLNISKITKISQVKQKSYSLIVVRGIKWPVHVSSDIHRAPSSSTRAALKPLYTYRCALQKTVHRPRP